MADILFISPYLELAEIALKVIGSENDVEIKVTRMDEAVDLALEAENQGYQVIISRGLTASKIKDSGIELPVVDIRIGGTDILRAYYEAKKLGDRVGIVDVEEVILGLSSLEKIIDDKLIKYTCENDLDDVVKGIDYLKERGVDVVIGKIAMAREARSRGIEAVIITSASEAVRMTILEARRVNQVRKLEKRKAEQKAAAEQRKAEQVARAEAYKLERKKRLTAQEKKRHETQVREIENRKKRVQAYYDKQMRNIEAASERENTRHEKRIAQIDEI